MVLLVTPLDQAAPKGRLILPQQQVLRAILDRDAVAVVSKVSELEQTLGKLAFPPTLVIADSQVFAQVKAVLPEAVPLTSFSIIFARYKGNLSRFLSGGPRHSELKRRRPGVGGGGLYPSPAGR